MKKWIRRWLGISEIQEDQAFLSRKLNEISNSMKDAKMILEIGIHNRALARIIAKLDPMYNVSEFDPERIAASKKLEDEILAKLNSEWQTSNRGQ